MSVIKRRTFIGVTLIEMLLVMAVISSLILMMVGYIQQKTLQTQINKTVTSAQQILNAAMAYYIQNQNWPSSLTCLYGTTPAPCNIIYFPVTLYNPFASTPANGYVGSVDIHNAGSPNFGVQINVENAGKNTYSIAKTISGKLPLNEVFGDAGATSPCKSTSTVCYVFTQVNVPAQALNNATAVKFSGLYHNGGCVSVPTCPSGLQAEIMVVPAAVAGTNNVPTNGGTATCNATNTSECTVQAYPLTSFTASAIGPADTGSVAGPGSCGAPLTPTYCYSSYSTGDAPIPPAFSSGKYWRVCLSVITENGQVVPSTNEQGQLAGTVMAITKCKQANENDGSDFTVWSQ